MKKTSPTSSSNSPVIQPLDGGGGPVFGSGVDSSIDAQIGSSKTYANPYANLFDNLSTRSSSPNGSSQQRKAWGSHSPSLNPKTSTPSDTSRRLDRAASPAIDPYTGNLDLKAVAEAAKSIKDALPPCTGQSDDVKWAYEDLKAELRGIARKAADAQKSAVELLKKAGVADDALPVKGELSAALPLETRVDLGYDVREHYAKAAECASKLANSKKLPKGEREQFQMLSKLFVELKRIHLTAVAPDHKQSYAQAEAKNLDTVGTGLANTTPGALLVTNAGVSGSVGVPGASVGGGFSRGTLKVTDDDSAILHFSTKAVNAGATVGVKDGVAVDLRAGVSLVRDFVVGGNLEEVLKTKMMQDANNSGGGSAARGARTGRHTWQAVKNTVKMALGRSYVPTNGSPMHLSDKKLAKGATTTRLHAAATLLDKATKAAGSPTDSGSDGVNRSDSDGGKPTWSELVNKFYPSVPKLVKKAVGGKGTVGDAAMPIASAVDRATPPPLALSNRHYAVVQPFAQVAVSVGKQFDDTALPTGVGATALGKIDQLNVHVRSPRAPHEVMDIGLLKDPQAVFKLVDSYDSALTATNFKSHRLQVYDQVRSSLSSVDGGVPKAADAFLGDNIPVQFYGAVNQPSAQRLQAVATQCDAIKELAATLSVEAEKFLAEPEMSDGKKLEKHIRKERREAFATLDEVLFKKSDGIGYPGGKKAALANKAKFVAECYDALSSALGLAEAHLFLNKRQLVAAGNKGAEDDIQKADEAYAKAREIMDKRFLGIRKDNLLAKHSSVNSSLVFNRIHGTGAVTVAGGADANLVGRAVDGVNGTIAQPSNLLKGIASIQVQTRLANKQVLDARLGLDCEITLNLETGVPLAGKALNAAIRAALAKAGLKSSNTDTMTVAKTTAELLQTVNTRTQGVALNIMFRQPPHSDGKAMSLAYVRLSSSATGGLVVSPSLPGTGNSVTGSVFELARGVQLEVLGPSLDYVSMQHGALVDAIKEAKADLEKVGKKSAFAADGKVTFAEAAAKAFNKSDFLRNRYFGHPGMIMKVLELHSDAVDAIRNNALPAPGEPVPNEFYRYYADRMFARARSVANEAGHHAPGSTAGGKDPFAVPDPLDHALFNAAKPGEARNHWDTQSIEWQTLKANVDKLKTPAERAKFFTTDKGGIELFESFCNVIGNIQDTWVATLNHADKERPAGFGAEVLTQRLTPDGKKLPKAKPQPQMTGIDGGPLPAAWDPNKGPIHGEDDDQASSASGDGGGSTGAAKPKLLDDLKFDDEDFATTLANSLNVPMPEKKPVKPVKPSTAQQTQTPKTDTPLPSSSASKPPVLPPLALDTSLGDIFGDKNEDKKP